MTSREVEKPKTLSTQSMAPPSGCPSPNLDLSRPGYYAVSDTGPPCRRSLRLASKSDPPKIPLSTSPSTNKIVPCMREEALSLGSIPSGAKVSEQIEGSEGLTSGVEVLVVENSTDSESEEDDVIAKEVRGNNKLKVDSNVDIIDLEDEPAQQVLCLPSGKRLAKRRKESVSAVDRKPRARGEEEDVIEIELEDFSTSVGVKRKMRFSREEKAKGKLVIKDLTPKGVHALYLDTDKSVQAVMHDDSNKEKLKEDASADRKKAVCVRKSREEKGKAKLGEGADTKGSFEVSGDSTVLNDVHMHLRTELQLVREANEKIIVEAKESRGREYRERFRAVARENASRFAHFNAHEEENHLPAEAAGESASKEMESEPAVEDWPGPFSTAMKIIRDRAKKLNIQMLKSTNKTQQPSLIWVPKNTMGCEPKFVPHSLKELCLRVLADNADALASLENIPDSLKHRLSHKLCGSRKMNGNIFSLFLRGSPYEVRVKDCSWLTEEQFTKSYEECDTSKLTVLQLDQCGRCMPDYILRSTIAQSPCSLPVLTTLSLSGACRLSDTGLSALVSSAPALRSINLNQCSLLTSDSIKILADKLGSVLHELYINDCQSIDAMLILPSLKRLEHLEVLSLASIETVGDDFVKDFVSTLGHNMKELVLTNCMKLTDSSMKVIAENCPGLGTLDLVDLCKLTDSTMGYLANGCRAIQTLKLRRNKFSDEAIAAFVESSGELLKELSLNCLKLVGQNTAFALSRRSRNLQSLDLSWCRNLTDEAVGLIVDGCSSLKLLKLFGCTQITNVFLEGHSNPDVEIVGLKMSPFLKEINLP